MPAIACGTVVPLATVAGGQNLAQSPVQTLLFFLSGAYRYSVMPCWLTSTCAGVDVTMEMAAGVVAWAARVEPRSKSPVRAAAAARRVGRAIGVLLLSLSGVSGMCYGMSASRVGMSESALRTFVLVAGAACCVSPRPWSY